MVEKSSSCPGRTVFRCLHEDQSRIPSHIVSRENPCCVSDRQSPPRSLWEMVAGEITQCRLVDTRCNTCVVVRGVVRDCLFLGNNV